MNKSKSFEFYPIITKIDFQLHFCRSPVLWLLTMKFHISLWYYFNRVSVWTLLGFTLCMVWWAPRVQSLQELFWTIHHYCPSNTCIDIIHRNILNIVFQKTGNSWEILSKLYMFYLNILNSIPNSGIKCSIHKFNTFVLKVGVILLFFNK